MKDFLLLIALLFVFGCQNQSTQYEEHESTEGQQLPNDWFYAQRAYPSGKINKKAYREALNFRATQIQQFQSKGSVDEWEFAGPTNVGGRISDVEMPVNSTDIIYAGAASGGIFKSEDQGRNWKPIFDDALSLSIGDMDIAPSDDNIIYVGTGEANAGGGSLAYEGMGVYKSTDAGETWQHLGLEKIGSVGKIEIHPTNPDIAYVGAMGNLFGDNEDRGVYKTTDGGSTWQHILKINERTGVIDLQIHPTNPDIIFAAAWERYRRPHINAYTGDHSGIYKSKDGGLTWDNLNDKFPPMEMGRIGLAIAPSNPNVIYAQIIDNAFLIGIFKSVDMGESWFQVSSEGIEEVGFMWWFGKLTVAPDDENRVYFIGYEPQVNYTGGQDRWETIFWGAHVDQHAIVSHPKNPNLLVLGNDGGVHVSNDGGQSYRFSDMPITQFYTCEMDYQNPERLYGGTQDNGTNRTVTGNTNDWEKILGGDGFYVIVDPTDNRYVYAESQNGNFSRSTDRGETFRRALDGINSADRNNWNTPVVLDPSNSETLYIGTDKVYKSIDRARNWTPISPDLTNGPVNNITINTRFATVTTLSVSPLDNQIIYAGTDDGNVWVTNNGGNDWDKISNDLPEFWVSRVVTDPFDVNTAFVTISGFRYFDDKAHIFKTTDLGRTWQSVSGNLPNIPINDMVINPSFGEWYIATDVGTYVSYDEGVNWELHGKGLPNLVITDLTFHEPTQTLLAATYGRSMYKIGAGPNVSTKNQKTDLDLIVFPNPTTDLLSIKSDHDFDFYKIVDLNGKQVLSEKLDGTNSISVSELPKGQYFLQVFEKGKWGKIGFVKG